jgi:signal transduction histidine kinase
MAGQEEGLRDEIAGLHSSRRRLVLAADDDRRALERELHDGVQQHLVALAVNIQLACQALETDSPEAKALLDGLARDVQRALDESMQLAERIYPPLLKTGGLAAAVRSAAASAGVRVSLDVSQSTSYEPDVAATLYWCCTKATEHADEHATVTVRDENGRVTFAITADASVPEADVIRMRDRVEALGGQLVTETARDGGTRLSGYLPG